MHKSTSTLQPLFRKAIWQTTSSALSSTSAWQTSNKKRQLQMLTDEWRDRFGAMPVEADQLVKVVKLRLVASRAGISAIKPDAQGIRLSVAFRLQQWLPIQSRLPKHLSSRTTYKPGSPGGAGPTPHILVRSAGVSPSEQLNLLDELLGAMVGPSKKEQFDEIVCSTHVRVQMNIQRFRSLIGLVCAASIGLAACGTKADKDRATTAENKGTSAGQSTGTTTTDKSSGTGDGAGKDSTAPGAPQELPVITTAKNKLDLASMRDPLVILNVDKTPITVGDYRRQFRMQEEQIRMRLSVDSSSLQQLLAMAKQDNVTLTEEEKKKLTETAKKALISTGTVLTKYLKDNHMTEKDFDQRVLDTGLGIKVASASINKSLLGELVDRELLCSAARAEGMGQAAMQKWAEIKKSPQYEQIKDTRLLTEDQIKDEAIKSELMQRMIQKLQQKTTATDQQISDIYEKNKDKFKHGPRIRLSQIFFAAPKVDSPAGESMKTQMTKAYPKLSPAEIDAKVKEADDVVRTRAREVLTKALKGDDFATLANENTDDMPMKAAKLGGDMGFQETERLTKDFAAHVNGLKNGQVFPQLIPSPLGYHIIKMVSREPAGTLPLSEVKSRLAQIVTQSNATLAVSNWLKEHRKSANITLSPEFQQLVSLPQKSIKPSAD